MGGGEQWADAPLHKGCSTARHQACDSEDTSAGVILGAVHPSRTANRPSVLVPDILAVLAHHGYTSTPEHVAPFAYQLESRWQLHTRESRRLRAIYETSEPLGWYPQWRNQPVASWAVMADMASAMAICNAS